MGTTSELAALNATGKGVQDISLPNRGTSTGTNGDTYGADISVDATNRLGSLAGTESNRADETCPEENC